MDLSQRALQTNETLFSNFEFLAEDRINFQKKLLRGVNIDQIAMCYITVQTTASPR